MGIRRLEGLLDVLRSALKREFGETLDSASHKDFIRKCKDLFYIGVNNATRALERMQHTCNGSIAAMESGKQLLQSQNVNNGRGRTPKRVPLQVVIIATDVHPRALVGHFSALASSKKVPLIMVNGGNGSGSLRLGEIFKLRTAIAIALKAGDSEVNKAMNHFLKDNCKLDCP
ncbi:hypothetical protein KP509_27G054300 [Ceratopteris richardii]|nr:hypothetical protein KP509_27G054300 [Ceratopteris richardii]